MLKTSFMTSNLKPAQSGVGLFGNLKVERGLSLFSGDLEKAFSVAKELGFDGIEISVADPEEISLSKVKDLVSKYQLGISSIATGGAAARDGLIFSSAKESIRKAAIQRIKNHIYFASHFGAVVVIGLIKGWVIDNYSQSEEYITDCLKECNKYAKEKNIDIALEPINRFQEDFFHSILDCKKYLDRVQLSNIKMMIDSFHMNVEDVDIWGNIRQAIDYIVHVHYSDSNRLAPGMGHFDFMKMTKILKEIEYKGYISAEILPVPDSYTAAKQTIDSMKSYLNQ
ncbi:sugar phosphate isomerase/epimerase [Candidatus Atribacteria bacterium 1244-E10-H5-B2]|nr:MAG: sugar phosphate isomerase/epimerase [Candidatus Atribacteria bacterium 1244-E10-H5-B2]